MFIEPTITWVPSGFSGSHYSLTQKKLCRLVTMANKRCWAGLH